MPEFSPDFIARVVARTRANSGAGVVVANMIHGPAPVELAGAARTVLSHSPLPLPPLEPSNVGNAARGTTKFIGEEILDLVLDGIFFMH